MSALWQDAAILMCAVVFGWAVGLAMGMRDKPGPLHVPDEAHPALDGPLGDIVRNGKVVRR
ncbi:hypothetical protein [Gordonia malaquae]|uniref:hypothetical protein n=1 Tax=Gordonia malaquae TaxID=410332 RepID=UPI0030FE3952